MTNRSGLLLGLSRAMAVLVLGLLTDVRADIIGHQASNDGTNVYYQLSYSGTPTYVRVYIDTDQSAATGYPTGGTGANYLLENGYLYAYSGTGGGWGWTLRKTVSHSNSGGVAKWTVARADIGETASPNAADLVFQVEAPLFSTAQYTHTYSDAPPTGSKTVVYTAVTDILANPERGFYHYRQDCNDTLFDEATLRGYRVNEQISLVMCIFYLYGFQNTAISQTALDKLRTQLATVRAAGLKAIVRFAYTQSQAGDDANKTQILAHLDQLGPILTEYRDVIYVMQAGFIGAWGEWAYSQNFGNPGNITSTDWQNRKAVADKLLAVLPADRMIQLRTPNFKRTLYSTTALTAAEAYTGTAKARIGHHNDCFLASSSDYGTYIDTSVEYPYLEAETLYLPMGGETCASNPPRSSCATALDELGRFHWSYLNADYFSTVLNDWTASGCMSDIKRRLGYRFVLTQGTYPTSVAPGAGLRIQLSVRNDGWAAPSNPRGRELVLRNTTTGALHRFALSSDPRRWLPGTTTTLDQTVTLPTTLPTGSYELLLNLHDPASGLKARPEYSIRLANANLWESSTGFNKLNHTLSVTP
jgi:hypothetical protein